MKPLLFAWIAVAVLFLGAIAHGEVYEFTLKGQVTHSSGFYDVTVGDEFRIIYQADSVDLEPSPLSGSYAATRASVFFPRTTTEAHFFVVPLSVRLQNKGTDRVRYWTLGLNYHFIIDFQFPAGTLESDALPLTLPLSSAMTAEVEIYQFGPLIRGAVTDYDSVEVPEPSHLLWLAMAMVLGMTRGKRAQRCC